MAEYNRVNPKDFTVAINGEVVPGARVSTTVNAGITKEPILGGEVTSRSSVIDKNLSIEIPITEEKFVQAMGFYPDDTATKYETSVTNNKTGNRTVYYGCQTNNYSDTISTGDSGITLDIMFDTRNFS